MDKNSHIKIGYIQAAFGIKGWLKIFSYCRPKQQILKYTYWQLRSANDEKTFQLEEGQLHGQGIIVKLAGIDDRNEAELLCGAEIWIASSELEALSNGEYYWFQLTGLEVVTTQGERLGVISHLIETGANDVLVIKGKDDSATKEILIPYIPDEVIKDVDLKSKTMLVDWQADYI